MHGGIYRPKRVQVIHWKTEQIMILMMMTRRSVLIFLLCTYNNLSCLFKFPEGPITSQMHISKMSKRRADDDTITTGSITSECKVVVKLKL